MVGDSLSQEQKILNVLHAAWPEWVPAPQLAQISLQYSARIFSLRHHDGWEIANKVETVDGVKHGFFRLGSPPLPRSKELRASRPREARQEEERRSQIVAPARQFDPVPSNTPPPPVGRALFDLHQEPD